MKIDLSKYIEHVVADLYKDRIYLSHWKENDRKVEEATRAMKKAEDKLKELLEGFNGD